MNIGKLLLFFRSLRPGELLLISIIFISILILPVWIYVNSYKLTVSIVIVLVYLILLVFIKLSKFEEMRKEVAVRRIVIYLRTNKWNKISNERIRKNIKKDYSDEFLEELVDSFPDKISALKVIGTSKKGIKLVD